MQDKFITENILNFIPTDEWSQEQKASFSLKFVELFLVFLSKELDKDLPANTDEKLVKLLETNPSEKAVVDFYNTLLPNLGDTIRLKAVEFKKLFILNLYNDKLTNLENQISVLKSKNQNTSEHEAAYKNWEKILEHAKVDKWEDVMDLISQL